MKTIPAYPLQWPAGWQRAASTKTARFGRRRTSTGGGYQSLGSVSVAEAVGRVRGELDRMRIADHNIVISTNLVLRLDGFPRSDQREPDDRGAAVYWIERGTEETRCMAIDVYDRVADNLAAIAATLEAMRAIERHGGAEILSRAFTGFTALEDQRLPWWDVLGVDRDARRVEIDAAFLRKRSSAHPDKGGTPEEFDRVQRAYERATSEISA